jgi:DNA-binding NtrC family response regulator
VIAAQYAPDRRDKSARCPESLPPRLIFNSCGGWHSVAVIPEGGVRVMPAAVLVVHDEENTRELAVNALRVAFLDAVGFEDPLKALDAIEASSRVRVLVTRVMFGPGKLNGVALARMVRVKRPGTKVVFVAREENAPHTEGLGVFLPWPLNPDILVATVSRLLVTRDDE